MKWYKEHFRAIIIGFILLLLLSLTVASYINEGSNSWLGVQLGRISTFLHEPVADVEKGITTSLKGIFQFKKLLADNEALYNENAQLKKQILNIALSRHEIAELRNLEEAMNYIDPSESYDYVTAKVIAMDGSNWYRIFSVNAGTKNGVRKNAVVINGDGLIGRVLDVGPNWAKVITVIDENNSVSFQVFRDLNLIGISSGDGRGKITGFMLDEEAVVIEGDMLITSGMEIYPQGIPIGKISAITWDSDGLLHTVEIESAVDFTKIQKVSIIMTGAEGEEPWKQ
jgi:rod shape-determining protein MreC